MYEAPAVSGAKWIPLIYKQPSDEGAKPQRDGHVNAPDAASWRRCRMAAVQPWADARRWGVYASPVSADGRTETSSSHLRGSAASRLRLSRPDPMRPLHLEESGHSTLEPRARASTPVNGEVSPPSAERRKAFELVRFGVAITDDSQKLLILARQKN